MPIRLMENFRALFYAPYYAALSGGFYAREGVEVTLLTSDAPGDAVPQLIDGAIDLTWGGPMRVMRSHDQDAASPLMCFGEMVARDPFLLIGRRDLASFALSDLPRLRFASVSEVPTPWMCLQHDLREQGLDPDRLPRIADRTMAQNADALSAGALDAFQAFEPFATQAEDDGVGRVVHVQSARGPTVYTAFIATREGIDRHRDEFRAMLRGLRALQDWWHDAPADELAAATHAYFPDVVPALLARCLQRYREAKLWARDPAMSRAGFERLGASFVSGGALSRPPVFEDCVATGLQS